MDYSIVFIDSEAGPCASCGGETGRGVVGWSPGENRPFCDACLIEVSPHLGMALNVTLIFREVGGIEPDGDPIELVYQMLTLASADLRVGSVEDLAGAQAGADRVREALRSPSDARRLTFSATGTYAVLTVGGSKTVPVSGSRRPNSGWPAWDLKPSLEDCDPQPLMGILTGLLIPPEHSRERRNTPPGCLLRACSTTAEALAPAGLLSLSN